MIHLIRGRAGSGKSRYIIERATQAIEKGHRVYLIVPDQSTFMTERRLAEAQSRSGLIGSGVFSFSRLCDRVLETVGGAERPYLDTQGAVMAITRILQERQEELSVFRSQIKSPRFASMLYQELCELRRYGILPQTLLKKNGSSLRVQDLALVFDAFLEGPLHSYTDSIARMDGMTEKIPDTPFLQGAHLFLDGFEMVTQQLLRAVRALMDVSDEMSITFRLGEENDPDSTIFETERTHYTRIENIAKETGKPIRQVALTGSGARPRHNHPALLHLERNLFSYFPVAYSGSDAEKAIRLVQADSHRGEAQVAVRHIFRLVREKGYRYRDIFVQLCDPSLTGVMEAALREGNIPFFLDEKRPMANKAICRYALSLLRCVVYGRRMEDVFSVLKSGFFMDMTEEDCYRLMAYQRYANLRYLTPSAVEREKGGEKELLSRILSSLTHLEQLLCGQTREMVQGFYAYLLLSGERIRSYLTWLEDKDLISAQEEMAAYKGLLNVLNQLVVILADTPLSPMDFYRMIQNGLHAQDLALVPPTADCVQVGDMARSRLPQAKVLLVLGAGEGSLPRSVDAKGVLLPRERERLEEEGLWLGNTLSERITEEELTVYGALTKPSEHLYLSYTAWDDKGNIRAPSVVVETMQRMFSLSLHPHEDFSHRPYGYGLSRESAARGAIRAARAYHRGQRVLKDYATLYRVVTEGGWTSPREESFRLSPYLALPLLLERDQISASRMESYARCPYQYFVTSGLMPHTVDPPGLNPRSRGALLHRAMELLGKENLTWILAEGDSAPLAKKIVRRMKEEEGAWPNPRARFEWEELEQKVRSAFFSLFYQIRKGVFRPISVEEFFSTDMVLELPVPKKPIRLIGRIDRIDTAQIEGVPYLRVVDYKSGSTGYKEEDIREGLTLQLPLYADAVRKRTGGALAGMFYMPIGKESEAKEREGAKENRLRDHRLSGILVDDPTVAEGMDQELAPGVTSDVIPAQLKKNGGFSVRSGVVSNERMERLIADAKGKAAELVSAMIAGEITPLPNGRANPCRYCEYHSMCGWQRPKGLEEFEDE